MNKHDFYKEIMSNYTLDREKIRRNAKRASSASFFARNSKWLPLTTAAAVFVAVFGGYMLLGGISNPSHVDFPINTGSGMVSDNDRWDAITMAEAMILSGDFREERTYMFISFAKPLTYKELSATLNLVAADTGAIEIVSLWSDASGGLVGTETAKNDESLLFGGAKVLAGKNLYLELSARSEFLTVEMDGVVSDNNFRPMVTTPSPSQPDSVPVVTTTAPPVTDKTPDTTPAVSEPAVPDPDADNPDADNDTNIDTEPALNTLEINIENAVSVDFINENQFVLLTKNSVMLFNITIDENGKPDYEIASNYDTANPKITFADEKTSTLLIIGGDAFGNQTNLFIADSVNGELSRIDTADAIIEQDYLTDISYAFYKNDRIVLKAQGADYHAIYTARASEGWSFEKVIEDTSRLIILNHTGNEFIYARIFEDGRITFNRYNADSRMTSDVSFAGELNTDFRIERSYNAGNFAIISGSSVQIWVEDARTMLPWGGSFERFYKNSGDIFSDAGGNKYIIRAGEITPISDTEANALILKPEFSSEYEITPSGIKIEIVS